MQSLSRPEITEQNLRTFIGNNADKIIRRGSRDISWCWPALFFSFFWLAYRKAYLAALIVLLIELTCQFVDFHLNVLAAQHDLFFPDVSILLLHVAVALFGLRYYLHFASKKLADINQDVADPALRQTFYQSKGGSSVAAVVGFFLLSCLANIFLWYLMDVPQQLHDLKIRTSSSQNETTQTTLVTVQKGNTTINSTIVQSRTAAS